MHTHKHTENFKWAFFINLAFSIIEVIGGFFFGSIAILTDALHDFSDSISLGLGWYFHSISKKSGNENYSYGYRRFSVLGAILNGTLLFIGSIIFITISIQRFLEPGEPMASGMMIMALAGIGFNYWAYRKLHSGQTLNEQVVSLHLLEDVMGWVAVLIGGILIYFFNWNWIDPLLSVLISLYIGYNALIKLKQSFHLILQGVPSEISIKKISEMCKQTDGVSGVNDIHIWSLDGELNVLTIHISVTDDISLENQHSIKESIRESLKQWKIQHATIEIDKNDFQNDKILSH